MSAVSSSEIAIESSELHVGQFAVAQSEARFKVLVAGRRCGKDRPRCVGVLAPVEGIPWPEVPAAVTSRSVPFLPSQPPRGQG